MSFLVLDGGSPPPGPNGERMRLDVVKSTDSNRGFRLFDNAVFTVHDVASEELFLDRVRIAYRVFDTVVRPHMDSALTVLAKRLVLATRICISRYFDRQSMARTDRPFVVKAEYRDSASLFCACSDLLRAYLYTRTADDPFANSNATRTKGGGGDSGRDRQRQTVKDFLKHLSNTTQTHTAAVSSGNEYTSESRAGTEEFRVQRLLCTLENRLMIEGGLASDLNVKSPEHAMRDTEYGVHSCDSGSGGGGEQRPRPEAVLYVIADVAALAELLSYMFYMTPVNLGRRYEVRTGCTAQTVRGNTDSMSRRAKTCCLEKSARYDSSDTVRMAISEFIRTSQRSAGVGSIEGRDDDNSAVSFSVENDDSVDSTITRVTRLQRRNEKLVKNLLLLLFDKSLSSIVDNGFDNANKRRRYGTDSKCIGGATVYTGILDTVGKINVRYGEGTVLSRQIQKGQRS